MSEKRNDKESMICLTPKPSKTFFVYRIQIFLKNLLKKSFLKKGRCRVLNEKQKGGFLTALAAVIKTSIREHAKELKVHKKTVRTGTKQDLSPVHNPLDYTF